MKLTETQFIMLDTETTHQDDPKVIELAGLRWVYGRPIDYTHFKENFINPGCKIHPASMAVHHILNEDVEDAPFIEELYEEWDEWVGSDIIVAYNSDYDQGVLSKTPLYTKKWLDAYRMAMHFWSLGQLNDDGFPLTSLKQQELRYWLNLPKTSGDAHRAAADIQVTAFVVERVIKFYLECGYKDDLDAFIEYVNAPVCHQTIPIGGRPYAGKTPEEIEDWAIKKAFDPTSDLFAPFKKFNIHECLLPEYLKRFGKEPSVVIEEARRKEREKQEREAPKKSKGFTPPSTVTPKAPASRTGSNPRWQRKAT